MRDMYYDMEASYFVKLIYMPDSTKAHGKNKEPCLTV